MKYIVKKFDSLHQYASYLNKAEMSSLFKLAGKEASKEGDLSFTMTSSYEEADNLLRFGDKENLSKLQTKLSKISLKGSGETKKVETYRSFVGYAPHVPSYISGQPKTMLRKRIIKTQNAKVLNIVYNPCAAACVGADELLEASIKVMNFISSIEKQGYKVNLYTFISTKNKQETVAMVCKIKSSDDYTDLAKMVYPMVHPSFLRRHFFRFIETNKEITERNFCYGYGTPVYDEHEANSIIKNMGVRCDYYISYYDHTYQLNKYTKQIN